MFVMIQLHFVSNWPDAAGEAEAWPEGGGGDGIRGKTDFSDKIGNTIWESAKNQGKLGRKWGKSRKDRLPLRTGISWLRPCGEV